MSLIDTVSNVTIDKAKARELLGAYRAAKAPATDEDRAIMTAYREIARGRVVIQARESIRAAGWNADGSPVLAMTRADIRRCAFREQGRSAIFYDAQSASGYRRAFFRVDGMPERPHGRWQIEATVPLIPLHLRPKHDLRNYWIMWEADWRRAPSDPILLRNLSGDLWLVLAAWELTAVERAVLDSRVNS